MQKGLISKAKKLLLTVVSSSLKNIKALNELAAIYTEEGDFEEAERNLSSVLQIDPANQEARQILKDLDQKVIEYHRNISKNKPCNREKIIVSIHIPKCGGTSFLDFLKKIYGNDLFLDNGWEWAIANKNKTSLTMGRKRPRCIHGHFLANKYDGIFPSALLITWVRHPVQRVASHYYYYLRNPHLIADHPKIRVLHENKLSLVEFAKIDSVRNWIVHYFAGKSIEDFDFVGIMEFYKESLEMLCNMIGISNPSEIPHQNFNLKRKNIKYEISKEQYDQILNLNSLDFAIYQSALEKFHMIKQDKAYLREI